MTHSEPQPTRVLVVDDSIFMRRTLERLIAAMPGFTVVGKANDGIEAVQRALQLRPDVITMDVEMPRMDGVQAVREIMQTVPTPVVMLSTLTAAGAETTIRALEAGAVECVPKPSAMSYDLANVEAELHSALRRARGMRLLRRRPPPVAVSNQPPAERSGATIAASQVVVIGASTGGPPALTEVIPNLPASLPAAVIVVQHMPAGFTAALARRLNSISRLPVKEAQEGDLLAVGQVLVAPGDHHLLVTPDRRVRLTADAALHGVRPAIDITLESVADVFGARATVAILTGMGRDGAAGAARVEAVGGQVFVQDEATSVIYGMPRVAREQTRHAQEVALEEVAAVLSAAAGRRRAA